MLRSVCGLIGLCLVIVPAHASASGGVSASVTTRPAATHGSGGGVPFGAKVTTPPPVSTLFSVSPRKLRADHAPHIVVRVDELRVHKVSLRLSFIPLHGDGRVLSVDGGRHMTAHRLVIAWPAHTALTAGRYRVILHATGPHDLHLLRRGAHASGRATLTVTPAPKPKPKAKPAPVVVTPTTPTTTTAPTAGGTFPVQGPHSYGDGFGAPRKGYSHQGQDVLAALGTPVVAPLAGTIETTGYQATAAGYYVVENADDGHAYFFAHCAHASTAVAAGQAVSEGQELCHVGQTGDATGPHLHFELWIGGWRADRNSHPIDPLSQLKAWDH